MTVTPGFVLDLDGTLLDSVYQHVIAWQRAFADAGLEVELWRVHRRVGMSGARVASRVAAETGHQLSESEQEKIEELHTRYYAEARDAVAALPGARNLLHSLTEAQAPWIIATSGLPEEAQPALAKLDLDQEAPLITSTEVSAGKPEPSLFTAAARRLGIEPRECLVVGDAVWDVLAARRAHMLSVGLLTGGIARQELLQAGALRVYDNPADLCGHLDEVGVQFSQ